MLSDDEPLRAIPASRNGKSTSLTLTAGRLYDETTSLLLGEITSCQFRAGGWFAKEKHLVVVKSSRGEFVWAAQSADAGTAFAAAVRRAAFDAQPVRAPVAGSCDVVLLDCGRTKIQVIKAIRAATGAGLKEAKALADAAPVTVATGLASHAALAFRRGLEEAGARVEIRGLSAQPAVDDPAPATSPDRGRVAGRVQEALPVDVPSGEAGTPGGEPVIAPLGEGEERLLQTVHRADGNRNDIYMLHRRPSDDPVTGAGEPINFVAVIRSTDEDPNDTSPPWAWQRGSTERGIYIAIAEANVNAPPMPGTSVTNHPGVQWFADRIREQAGPGPTAQEALSNQVQLYVEACGEVLRTAKVCLDAANSALGARNMVAQRPQAEASIRSFAQWAEQLEREFGPVYRAFEAACSTARDAAAQISGARMAEMIIAMGFSDDVVNNVATAKAVLSATYGPTPAGFVRGVDATNALIENPPDDGLIYRPPRTSS